MYSDKDILRAIEKKELIIDPFSKDILRPAGVVLHLGKHLLKPLPGRTVDVKNKIIPDFEEITISDNTPYNLEPGEFILGHTYESITVGNNLSFLIEGRSTLARVGLTIVQTAMLVYPGHRNRAITLEAANHGPNPILLYPRMKIARAAIVELKTPASIAYDDQGKYRGQAAVGRPIFKDEIMK